jgi:hypothetical protein
VILAKQRMAIICPVCNEDTFVRREPIYEGFSKSGESITCVSCGHQFDNEDEIPFKDISAPSVFTAADRSNKIEVFRSDEKGRNCRHCRHYTVNPFIQRCGLHQMEVQATDLCEQFDVKTDDDSDEDTLAELLKG